MRALVALHNPPQNDPAPRSPSATAKPIRCRSPSRSLTARRITTIARSRSDHRRSACVRRRMHGRRSCRMRCASSPRPHFINWQQDPQGNHLARVVFPERVTHFDVTVDLVADMATINPFDFFMEPDAEHWPFSYDPLLEQELAPFRRLMPVGPRLQELLDQVPRGEQAHRGHAGRAEPHGAEPRQLHRPHGAWRVDARRDAGGGRRLVPGFGLAAGAAAAPTRLRRALRLRLSDPARRPT